METGGSIFLFHPLRPPQPQLPSPWRLLHAKPFSLSRKISCSSNNNSPRWDSNAESFQPRNFNFNAARNKPPQQDQEQDEFGKKRRWWSDDSPAGFQEESAGFWEEAIESLWILKVFKSYGWTLPIILGSWLLSSGPKAFLMALALPLGQSALALAFEKLWGQPKSKPKRKYRMRRKSRTANSTRFEEEPEENQKSRKGKTGYQSWLVENDGSVDNRGSRESPSFGGWDDLERSRPTRSSHTSDGSRRMAMEAGRLSRRERKSDTPLLLRLLIAVFPFLGTWTKML